MTKATLLATIFLLLFHFFILVYFKSTWYTLLLVLVVLTECKLRSAAMSKQYWPVPFPSPYAHKQTFYYGSVPKRAGTQVPYTEVILIQKILKR